MLGFLRHPYRWRIQLQIDREITRLWRELLRPDSRRDAERDPWPVFFSGPLCEQRRLMAKCAVEDWLEVRGA